MADNISINNIQTKNNILEFYIENVNISIINALRRIILSDIPCYVFRTLPYEKNNVTIHKNTSRINNEFLKQRMSCIPIHLKVNEELPIDDLIIELDKKNDTNHTIYVTSEDFKIKNTKNDTYLNESQLKEIFPPDPITGDYIILTRLKPRITPEIPGEEINMEAKIVISSAKEDSAFNMVSTCSYQMAVDNNKQDEMWNKKEKELKNKNLSSQEIQFEKENFYLLDGKRYIKNNEFRFLCETIGVYSNNEIIIKGCDVLIDKFNKVIEMCNNETLELKSSNTLMSGYDIILQNEGYTLGKALEYSMNELFYNKVFDFIGFRKFHPHDDFSVIRVPFINDENNSTILYSNIKEACNNVINIFEKIKMYFVS
jgi:DNA-directed RNA polymerase alpha subunit